MPGKNDLSIQIYIIMSDSLIKWPTFFLLYKFPPRLLYFAFLNFHR